MLKAVLFDLDGVVTDTAKFHYLAWKEMATTIGIEIDENFNESLKGIDRRASLLKILELKNLVVSDLEFDHLMKSKNDTYLMMLKDITEDDILPGIKSYIESLADNGIKIAIASASMNAPYIIEKLNLVKHVDFIANPSLARASKPDPSIFLLAAEGVGVNIEDCIGIEDSNAGIQAIKNAGCRSIGIGRDVVGSDCLLQKTSELNIKLTWCVYEK